MSPTPRAPRHYTVDVSNHLLRTALLYVGSRAGWSEAPSDPDAVSVTDHPLASTPCSRRRRVLVADASPYGARQAIRVLASGDVAGVISATEPEELVPVLESVESGYATVSLDLLQLADSMPELTPRQIAVLGAVMAGQSNRQISRALYLSDASVKREIAGLFRALGADNRLELASRGAALGLQAKRLEP